VGYHNKFIGTFKEVRTIIQNEYLGDIQHFMGEAYEPVVLRKSSLIGAQTLMMEADA